MDKANFATVEVWRPVVGYEKFYSVSSIGRVRNDVDRKHTFAGKILKLGKHSGGYSCVNLSVNGRRSTKTVHSLVVKAFIGDIPSGFEVNHRNGIKTDNRVENLEIVTPSENQKHLTYVLGCDRIPPEPRFGERHPHSKFTDAQILEMRQLWSTGKFVQREIAEMFGTGQTVVGKIVRRVAWSHI